MSAEPGGTALFAYGSLVSIESVTMTLGRRPQESWPAVLRGWRRSFSLRRDNRRSEKTFARTDDGSVPDWILSLNLEHPGGGQEPPNGALIAVSEEELGRLDARELRYERRDVTADVSPTGSPPSFDAVVTYVARPENLASHPPPGAVILRSYVDAVEAAFARAGPAELAAYRRSTGPPPVEVAAARLVRDEIPPGNPRAW